MNTMNDDENTAGPQPWIDPALEARVVASVLGEASAFESAELDRLIAENPELAIFKRRIEAVHALAGVAVRPQKPVRRLSPERRRKLLEALGGSVEKPKTKVAVLEQPQSSWWSTKLFVELAVMLSIVLILSSISMPAISGALSKARAMQAKASREEQAPSDRIEALGTGDSVSPSVASAPSAAAPADPESKLKENLPVPEATPPSPVLKGLNTYSGQTSVSAGGTLVSNGALAFVGHPVAVSPGKNDAVDSAVVPGIVSISGRAGGGGFATRSHARSETTPASSSDLLVADSKKSRKPSVVDASDDRDARVQPTEQNATNSGESGAGVPPAFSRQDGSRDGRPTSETSPVPWSSSYASWCDTLKIKPAKELYVQSGHYPGGSAPGGITDTQYSPASNLVPAILEEALINQREKQIASESRNAERELDPLEKAKDAASKPEPIVEAGGYVQYGAPISAPQEQVISGPTDSAPFPYISQGSNRQTALRSRTVTSSKIKLASDVPTFFAGSAFRRCDVSNIADSDKTEALPELAKNADAKEKLFLIADTAGTRPLRKLNAGKASVDESSKTKARGAEITNRKLDDTKTASQPFSTFSLHVSDVSFQLAKDALARGEMPDPTRIRPEEFYNAIDYSDPAPAAGEEVTCRIEQCAHPILQQRNLVRIAMKVAASGRNAGQPLRLTVLLDTSGSMEREDRAASVRQALKTLATLLGPNDRITLIGFARTPRLLAEQVPGDQAVSLVEIAARTPSEGGTNLELALALASEMALKQRLPAAQNRIVLLTDGAANLGNANPARLARQIEKTRQQGVSFDACGVGANGLNDEILEALTRKGDGRYYFLNKPEDADAGFARQLAGAFRPAAENVKVQVRFNAARVSQYRLIGFEKHLLKKEDFRNDKVGAAELSAEEAGVAVYQVETLPEGEGELGEVSVRFRDPANGQMVERAWTMPYEAKAPGFDRASPSMQLAATAALVAERLQGNQEIDLNALAPAITPLRAQYPNQTRVGELIQMVERLRK